MPRVDRQRFPRLVIQVPEGAFPDNIKVIVTGRALLQGAAGKTAQLASEIKSGALGQPVTPTYFSTNYTESDFKRTINGKKTAELKTPYDEIVNVIGYAHREDPKDDRPVNVFLFTTTQSGYPSARGSTVYMEGVFAYQMTLTRQNLNAAYITRYIQEATIAGQVTAIAGNFAALLGQVMAIIVAPSLPTPKQVASKVMGPAAAPVQNAIATNADKVAKVKKTTAQLKQAANAIQNIISDPSSIAQYMPVVVGFLVKFIGQDKIAQIIYDFRSSA
jgi:hypothetical protein